MSESKQTKGPWICYADLPSTEPNWHIITTDNKMRVLANVHIEPGNEMDEANARLITAAPELFEALKRLTAEAKLDGMDKKAGWDCWISLSEEALAKVESRQSEGADK